MLPNTRMEDILPMRDYLIVTGTVTSQETFGFQKIGQRQRSREEK
jgi:hypothetical protein